MSYLTRSLQGPWVGRYNSLADCRRIFSATSCVGQWLTDPLRVPFRLSTDERWQAALSCAGVGMCGGGASYEAPPAAQGPQPSRFSRSWLRLDQRAVMDLSLRPLEVKYGTGSPAPHPVSHSRNLKYTIWVGWEIWEFWDVIGGG